jgi:hypothetical protein
MRRIGFTLGAGLALASAAGLLSGCANGGGSGGGGGSAAAAASGGGGTGTQLLVSGGNGEEGGEGGRIILEAAGGIRASGSGGKAKIARVKGPARDFFDASGDFATLNGDPDDLDPDDNVLVIGGDVVVPGGKTLTMTGDSDMRIDSVDGSVFIFGDVTVSGATGNDGGTARFRSFYNAVVVGGRIDAGGTGAGGDGGAIIFESPTLNVLGGAVLDVSGAVSGASRGGDGGSVRVTPLFGRGTAKARQGYSFDAGSTVILAGGDGSGGGGDAGQLEILIFDTAADVALIGKIEGAGGDTTGTVGSGGDGGTVEVRTLGNLIIDGTLDLAGGLGVAESGGDGGQVVVAIGNLLTLRGRPVVVDGTGGDGADGSGGRGGDFTAFSGLGPVAWTGDLPFEGGNSSSNSRGADGGTIEITSLAPGKSGNVSVVGKLSTFGTNAGANSNSSGGEGGSVLIATANGSLSVIGDIDTHGGNGQGSGDGGDAGSVALLVDDLDPDTSPLVRDGEISLLGNVGGTLAYTGALNANGGDAGATGDGGRGGDVVMDSDGNDGEERTNGGGRLGRGSTIRANGGDAPGGTGGHGGNVMLRGSDRSGLTSSTDGFDDTGAVVTNAGGTGTSAGAAGSGVVD